MKVEVRVSIDPESFLVVLHGQVLSFPNDVLDQMLTKRGPEIACESSRCGEPSRAPCLQS